LIETFHYEWIEENLTSSLKIKLEKQGIICKPIKSEDVLKKLREEGRIADWSDLLKKALQAIRVERLTEELIANRLERAGISQPKNAATLLDALHQGYIQELKNQNAIDFDDMIIRAIQVIENEDYIPKWRYILVDEFQDISAARMEFIKAIIAKGPEPSLTVVGDDWQSIYRFSGGKLELTTRFGEMIGNYTATKLQKPFATTTVSQTLPGNS
jgi:DNA helicase-4